MLAFRLVPSSLVASLLARLAQLQQISIAAIQPQVDCDQLTDAIAQCSQTRTLHLGGGPLNAEQMQRMLAGLPSLNSLSLVSMSNLQSLAFLSHLPHLTSSLRALHLQACPRLPPSELHHIFSLSSLERLQMHNDSFSQALHHSALLLLALEEGRSQRAERCILPSTRIVPIR